MAEDIGTLRGQIILDVKQALGAYRQVRKDHQSLVFSSRQVGDAFYQSGIQMVAGGTALVAVFAKAVTSAAEFERKMDFFAAVSATGKQKMDELTAATLRMAEETIYSADQVAEGFIELGKAGVSAQQIIDGVGDAVLSLGAAGDIPLAQSGQIITSVIQQFALAAEDATNVADKLAGAANASIVEIDDLGVSLKYVGGVASAAGLSFEDVNTALAILGKAGIRGSTAGTSLRQMLVSLGGATGPAREALREIGVLTGENNNKFYDQQGRLKSLDQVYQILQDSLAGYTQKEKLAYLRTIFNNRALSAAAILTREGADGFKEMNAEISKTTAADVAAKRLDNLSGDIEILRGNIETFMIKAGTPFQEFLRDIVQSLTYVVQTFGKLPESVQTATFAMIGIVGVMLILIGLFNIVLGTIFHFVDNMARLAGAGGAVKVVFKTIGRILLGMLLFLPKLAMWIIRIFMNFTPWGRIVSIVILLATAIWELWQRSDKFREVVGKIGSALAGAFQGAVGWIRGVAQSFIGLFQSGGRISNMIQGIRDAFATIKSMGFSGIVAAIGQGLANLGGLVVSALSKVPALVGGFFLGLPGIIIGALLSIPPKIFGIMGQIVGSILGFLITLPIKALALFIRFNLLIITTLMGLLPRLAGWAGFIIGFIIGFFLRLIYQALMFGIRFTVAFMQFLISLPGRIIAFLGRLVSMFVTGIGRIISWVISNAPRIGQAVINGIRSLPGLVWGIITRIPGLFMNMVGRAKSSAVAFAKGFWNGVKEWVNKIPGIVSGVVGDAIAAFKGVVKDAFNAAKSFAKGLWDGFKKGLGIESPSYIERAMWQISGVMAEETRNIRRNVHGIQGMSKMLAKTSFETGFDAAMFRDLAATQKASDLAQSELASALASPTREIKAEIAADMAAKGKKVVPIDGKVRFDEDSKAVFTGWAEEVDDENKDFDDSLDRMGPK